MDGGNPSRVVILHEECVEQCPCCLFCLVAQRRSQILHVLLGLFQ
jgi:hypothetical protein